MKKNASFLSDIQRERKKEKASSKFPIRPKEPVINVTNDSCCSPRRKRLFPRSTKSKLALGERGAVTTAHSSRKQSHVFFCSCLGKPMPRATNHKGITRRKKPALVAQDCIRAISGYPILSNRRENESY